MFSVSPVICWLLVLGSTDGPPERRRPEARAVAFLSREVPRWSRENHCYSCHNNGDAARALYQASRTGIPRSRGGARGYDPLADPAGGLGS